MGSSERALRIVLQEENDLQWAIRICQEHSDHNDLWNILIDHSLDKPGKLVKKLSMTNIFISNYSDYIRELLNNMGAHVDPLLILQKIPVNLKIPDLRNAVIKILHDYELKVSDLKDRERSHFPFMAVGTIDFSANWLSKNINRRLQKITRKTSYNSKFGHRSR